MERYLGALLILCLASALYIFQPQLSVVPPVFADAPADNNYTLPTDQPITTESLFKENFETTTEVIPKKTVYTDDPNTEVGTDTTLDEGADGQKVTTTKVTYYEGQEYSREVVSVDITPAKDRQISRGTKIVWRTLDTPDGQITYKGKLQVYATDYDGGAGCSGCSGRGFTAIGLRVTKGVIAVDPNIIPLGSHVYVTGYGPAIAGDTGGAIKGNIIDLGFDDARTSGWHSQYVDIYLL